MNFFGVPMSQTYTGTFSLQAPIISGTVRDLNGTPIPGVVVHPSGSLASATTDTNGSYSLPVLPSWTGTITPIKSGWISKPASINYDTVFYDLTSQDFVLLPAEAFRISSNIQGTNLNLSWFGLPNEIYLLLASTNLVDWYPYDGTQLVGTNGPINITVPVDTTSTRFFRFGAN